MTKYFIGISTLIISVLVFNQCNRKANATNSGVENHKTAKLISMEKNGITLTEFYAPETFENASILQSMNASMEELDNNIISLNFSTTNYKLGEQTNRTSIKNCANAVDGQHIHCIVDNQPYNALYKDSAKVKTLSDGQHIVLSFLSRSYHESIKNKNAYTLTSVITGKSRYTARYAAPDLTSPMLFYSRPKGEYKGDDTKAVLLDFYLVNVDLSKDGYKVKAEINGNVFMLDKWCGYFIEGLPLGENTIKLTLVDAKGKKVEGAFNETERKIKLSN